MCATLTVVSVGVITVPGVKSDFLQGWLYSIELLKLILYVTLIKYGSGEWQ